MDLTRTEDNGGHSFVPIAAKWLASGTDDDDDDDDDDDTQAARVYTYVQYGAHVDCTQ